VGSKIIDSGQPNERGFSESLRHSIWAAAICSLLALLIFGVGKFAWWVGIVLFAIFVFYILNRLAMAGFLLIVECIVAVIMAGFIRARGLSPASFDGMVEKTTDLLWLNILIAALETYLVVITVLLGVSFFW